MRRNSLPSVMYEDTNITIHEYTSPTTEVSQLNIDIPPERNGDIDITDTKLTQVSPKMDRLKTLADGFSNIIRKNSTSAYSEDSKSDDSDNLFLDTTPIKLNRYRKINCTTPEVQRELLHNRMDESITPSELISQHVEEIQIRILGHSTTSQEYDKKEKALGFPITIISSFVASSFMLTANENKNNHINAIIKYGGMSLSIVSFLMSISRNYLDYAARSNDHDLSAKLYTTLMRSIEMRIIKMEKKDSQDKQDLFCDIVSQMSIIEQYERAIPEYIERSIRLKIGNQPVKKSILTKTSILEKSNQNKCLFC
jgi:hypothetical protein